jgi:hypothetical protein
VPALDRNEIIAEFQKLHALAKTGPLDEASRKRWIELKRLLIVLDQPKDDPLLEPCASEE